MSDTRYTLSCDCGGLAMTVHGRPVTSVYCHCPSCRAFHDVDVFAATAWAEDQVELPQGDANALFEYAHPHKQMRRFGCRQCGAILYSRHRPGVPVIQHGRFRAANGGKLPAGLEPSAHLFYAERVLDIDDDLPKSLGNELSKTMKP